MLISEWKEICNTHMNLPSKRGVDPCEYCPIGKKSCCLILSGVGFQPLPYEWEIEPKKATDKTCKCGGSLKQLAIIDPDYREYVCTKCKQTYGQRRSEMKKKNSGVEIFQTIDKIATIVYDRIKEQEQEQEQEIEAEKNRVHKNCKYFNGEVSLCQINPASILLLEDGTYGSVWPCVNPEEKGCGKFEISILIGDKYE